MKRTPSIRCVDGLMRTPERDAEIDEIVRDALCNPAGAKLLDYVKSITTSRVLDSSATDAQLRMQEGMRQLASILDLRSKSKPKEARQ